mmetsp:Transcript_8318/g.13206  ORF Transcript_8318/g.13206 Transcript_8318/m.13206 type:complete len:227 (-) Transcript_8318:366-1046(-)
MVVKGPLSSFSSSSLSSSSSSSSFEWERDAKGFYDRHFIVLFVAALMYYPVILGIKYLMRNRKAFDLGGAKSRAMVNWIFWWEASLAAFSFVAATQVVPLALEPLYEQGLSWSESICKLRTHDDPRAFWMFLFNLSKVFEFGDTVLVVLRKKKLIMLQHYHHLATMIYCWYATVITYRYYHFYCLLVLLPPLSVYSYVVNNKLWLLPSPPPPQPPSPPIVVVCVAL